MSAQLVGPAIRVVSERLCGCKLTHIPDPTTARRMVKDAESLARYQILEALGLAIREEERTEEDGRSSRSVSEAARSDEEAHSRVKELSLVHDALTKRQQQLQGFVLSIGEKQLHMLLGVLPVGDKSASLDLLLQVCHHFLCVFITIALAVHSFCTKLMCHYSSLQLKFSSSKPVPIALFIAAMGFRPR